MTTYQQPLPLPARGSRPLRGGRAEHPVDAGLWPDVARVPNCSPARLAVGRAIVERALRRLPLTVRLAPARALLNAPASPSSSGAARVLGTGGPLIEVHDPDAFLRRIAVGGLVGFGESYQAGEWDAPDLAGALTVLAEQLTELVPAPLQRLRRLWALRHPAERRNTPTGSRANIRAHYDLSNELFATFLDPSLTYSAAVFDRLPAVWDDLHAAQLRKIDHLLDLAGVGPGTRVLEIGTGWGELALRAAGRGATVVSLTLSAEQRELAQRRVREAGVADAVEIRLEDYRESSGRFDAVVSVEMIEAVGVEFWPEYFRTIDARLAPGGRAALQAITMPDDRLRATADTYTWIQKYIFPGGMLPSLESVDRTTRAHTALRLTGSRRYGPHYAETLRLWRERFTERADEVAALGFDEVFRRMWALYLAYSEAGFRSGYLDVRQLLLTRA